HSSDWTSTPAPLRRMLESCLKKDPRQRVRSAADALLLIDEAPTSEAVAIRASARASRLWPAAFAIAVLAAGAISFERFREPRPLPPASIRFEILPPAGTTFTGDPAISPDGQNVVFSA